MFTWMGCFCSQFFCQLCRKSIKHKKYFVFHLRAVHNLGKPVRCKYCGKDGFEAPATFSRHVKKCKQEAINST